MGSSIAPCGCISSWSMFGDHELAIVQPCWKHAIDPRMQEALRQVLALMGQIHNEERNGPYDTETC